MRWEQWKYPHHRRRGREPARKGARRFDPLHPSLFASRTYLPEGTLSSKSKKRNRTNSPNVRKAREHNADQMNTAAGCPGAETRLVGFRVNTSQRGRREDLKRRMGGCIIQIPARRRSEKEFPITSVLLCSVELPGDNSVPSERASDSEREGELTTSPSEIQQAPPSPRKQEEQALEQREESSSCLSSPSSRTLVPFYTTELMCPPGAPAGEPGSGNGGGKSGGGQPLWSRTPADKHKLILPRPWANII